jgi:amino acid transporter
LAARRRRRRYELHGGDMRVLHTIKAVAWSFIGIRKSSAYQEDLSKLNPLHIIIVALVGVALFVGGLVLLVNWVVAK